MTIGRFNCRSESWTGEYPEETFNGELSEEEWAVGYHQHREFRRDWNQPHVLL